MKIDEITSKMDLDSKLLREAVKKGVLRSYSKAFSIPPMLLNIPPVHGLGLSSLYYNKSVREWKDLQLSQNGDENPA